MFKFTKSTSKGLWCKLINLTLNLLKTRKSRVKEWKCLKTKKKNLQALIPLQQAKRTLKLMIAGTNLQYIEANTIIWLQESNSSRKEGRKFKILGLKVERDFKKKIWVRTSWRFQTRTNERTEQTSSCAIGEGIDITWETSF